MPARQLAMIAFLIPLSFWAEKSEAKDGPEAGEILKKVLSTYVGCKSYRDEGAVANEFTTPDGKAEKPPESTFTTAFIRPDRLKLDFRHNDGGTAKRSVIWTLKDGARSWWDLDNKVEKAESLDFALGARAGVTMGVSTEIPTLLLASPKADRPAPFSQLKKLKRLDDGKINGVDCYKIEGRLEAFNFRTGQPFETVYLYTVERPTSVIRQVRIEMPIEGGRVVTKITYKPHLDERLADEALSFDPGSASKPKE
jgi:hypothetical protein